MPEVAGHAFICYVREDATRANELADLLRDAGIPVWMDTASLWPGENWRAKIREAITRDSLAFVACFSAAGVAKPQSGQTEELYLAADEFRRRRPGVPWIFPVRFDECELPRIDLGAGLTFDSLQRADLFGPQHQEQERRLVRGVLRVLDPLASEPARPAQGLSVPSPKSLEDDVQRRLREALRDPLGDIRLYELVIPMADEAHGALDDRERFSTHDQTVTVDDVVVRVDAYWDIVERLLEVFVTGAAWGQEAHDRIWTEAIERVARACNKTTGLVAYSELRRFPLLPVVYGAGLAAVYRENYRVLRAVAVDATVREIEGPVPIASQLSPWAPFSSFPLPAQVLALRASGEIVDGEVVAALNTGRRGNRFTPTSDQLHDRLRPHLRWLILDDDTYSDIFDRLEVVLGLVVADLRRQARPEPGQPWRGPWIGSPTTGRFTWRDRHAEPEQRVERRLLSELVSKADQWPPLRAGLFGGSVARASAAFDDFLPIAENARSQRW